MNDVLIVVVLALVCTGVGLPAARLLPAPAFRLRLLGAPVLGLAILAVLVTAGYRLGLSPGAALVVAGVAAAALLALEVRRWLGGTPPADAEERGWLVAGAGVWLAALVVLLLPRFVGGDQFSVFQGNQWDTFGYLESALVYAREPYGAIAAAGRAEFLRNPLVNTAAVNLYARPSVHLLYAAASRVAPADAYRLHYAFLALLLSLSVPVAFLAVRAWLPGARLLAVAAIAPAFALGFWGQYVFDINAWSQLSSVPILLLAFVLLVEAGCAPLDGLPGRDPWRLAGALALLVAGATYLYPESLVYHLAVLVPLAAAAIGVRSWRAGRRTFAPFVPLVGVAIGYRPWRAGRLTLAPFVPLAGVMGGLAGVLYWQGTVGFVLGQVATGTRNAVPWWHFFQAFFFGRTGEPGAQEAFGRTVDFLAGLLGLYFATPSAVTAAPVAALQRLVLLATIAALLAAVAAASRVAKEAQPPRLLLASIAGLGLLVPAARLALTGQFWSAGKATSFASPVLVLLLALPLAASLPGRWPRLRWVTGAFVAFQLATGLARIAGAADASGVHFAAPYPALQEPPLKQVLRWDVEPLAALLGGARQVLVAPMNPWSAHWLMCFLHARGTDYFALGPVVPNFGAGAPLGQMEPPWEGDALVGLGRTPRGWVVQYADGRPPALVAWPESLR